MWVMFLLGEGAMASFDIPCDTTNLIPSPSDVALA